MPSDTPSNITIGTTNVSLNNIKNAFNGTTTKLSDYYRGGTNIYNITRLSNIPTSGPISFGNFKNTTNVILAIAIISNSANKTSGPQPAYNTRTTNFSFDLPSDRIKISNIISIIFYCTITGTVRTTVRNIFGTFKASLNGKDITGILSIDDTVPNYAATINTITTSNVTFLTASNNNLYMYATSSIPAYTDGVITIRLNYLK
jgi:hypothetical protein